MSFAVPLLVSAPGRTEGQPVTVGVPFPKSVLSDPQRIRLVDLAESPEGFVALVRRLETGLPPRQQAAQARLRTEGWEAKARQFETWALAEQPG